MRSHKSTHSIRVSYFYLALNAVDGPIVAFVPTEETKVSLMCALARAERGGHLGWFQGGGFGSRHMQITFGPQRCELARRTWIPGRSNGLVRNRAARSETVS